MCASAFFFLHSPYYLSLLVSIEIDKNSIVSRDCVLFNEGLCVLCVSMANSFENTRRSFALKHAK